MKFLLCIAALAATCPALAQGASEAILDYTDDFGSYLGGTFGWTFQATNALTVTSLGCFADVFTENPAVTIIQVGLWAPDGTLLASNSVTPSSPLFDQTRYESIPPILLATGKTYHLGVSYFGSQISLEIADPDYGGLVSTSVEIQLGSAAF